MKTTTSHSIRSSMVSAQRLVSLLFDPVAAMRERIAVADVQCHSKAHRLR